MIIGCGCTGFPNPGTCNLQSVGQYYTCVPSTCTGNCYSYGLNENQKEIALNGSFKRMTNQDEILVDNEILNYKDPKENKRKRK
ncbi:MAG: hypothetical protein QM539_08045 [Alphaproteobacteria bacterium]|nr:hypothetical protein [Alphaproteobacteria bacterium]